MKVLVDTSVWSLSLRKRKLTGKEENTVSELKELIHELRVEMIGAIRQELLSGIPDNEKYEVLRDKLRAFDDLPLTRSDFERAAEFFNQCRKRGIQGNMWPLTYQIKHITVDAASTDTGTPDFTPESCGCRGGDRWKPF